MSVGSSIRRFTAVGAVLAMAAAMLIAIASPASAATIRKVATTGTDSGDCATTACKTVGYALSQAAAGDTVLISAGTYKVSNNPSGTANLVPAALAGVTITSDTGAGASAADTIIDATGAAHGLVVNANNVTVNGLTIENALLEGLLVSPPEPAPGATPAPANVTGETISNNVVTKNDQCAAVSNARCPPPSAEDDFGEGLHLDAVAASTISGNTVTLNVGGILVTDELGPNHDNTISNNNASNNPFDCGITLASHNPNAVATSGADAGKPQPTQGGVYNNTISGNTANKNGAAGLLNAAAAPGMGAYNNKFLNNTANDNGLAGMTVHAHAPFQDIDGLTITGNTFNHDALFDGAGGGPGDGDASVTKTAGILIYSAVWPVHGITVSDNKIADVYYGVWISYTAASTTLSNNTISVTAGGVPIFVEPAPASGYWEVAKDGGMFTFGALPFKGAATGVTAHPIVGMAATPDRGGYWLAGDDGGIFSYGDANFYGSTGAIKLNKPIVGIAATHDGGGYWMVASDGGVFNFGTAGYLGSMGGKPLNSPIVGMVPTASGFGYYLVAKDGGVFTFGDAKFMGSMGAVKLNQPVVGIATTAPVFNPNNPFAPPSTAGYYLVAADGGIFTFGNAKFLGSTGAIKLKAPVVGMGTGVPAGAPPATTGGYWLFASDSGVFSYGNTNFFGSLGDKKLNAPVVGAVAA